jgi:hypothetical protein
MEKLDKIITEEEMKTAENEAKFNENEELLHMSLQMRKIQDDVLNRYFTNSDVIKMNYLEHIKAHTKQITSKEEFKDWLESEMKRMKSKGSKFTHIERIEYRMIRKVYEDVIEDKGEEFSFGKDLVYQYDDNEIKVEPIEFGEC